MSIQKSIVIIYRKARAAKRLSQLLMLVSFLSTFLFVRIITHLQKAEILPNQQGDLHIHHMVPGMILILVSGYIGLSFWSSEKIRRYMSILFGIGAALTIDEFALWLFLKDVYWSEQGRNSIDAVIITIAVLTLSFMVSEVYERKLKGRINLKRKKFSLAAVREKLSR